MGYKQAKEKVLSELYIRGQMTDNRIYNFCLAEIFNYDVNLTDNFMLSDFMGYTIGDLKKIKKNKISAINKNWLTENEKLGRTTPEIFHSL